MNRIACSGQSRKSDAKLVDKWLSWMSFPGRGSPHTGFDRFYLFENLFLFQFVLLTALVACARAGGPASYSISALSGDHAFVGSSQEHTVKVSVHIQICNLLQKFVWRHPRICDFVQCENYMRINYISYRVFTDKMFSLNIQKPSIRHTHECVWAVRVQAMILSEPMVSKIK